MFDLFHEWGSDLAIGSTGDIALVADSDATQQRVYRRLLTIVGVQMDDTTNGYVVADITYAEISTGTTTKFTFSINS